MEGIIIHFRGSHKTKWHHPNQMVIKVERISSKEEAAKLVGKKVSWITPGKSKRQLTGQITAAHGNSGAVRARFDIGLPGQSLGEKVIIQ